MRSLTWTSSDGDILLIDNAPDQNYFVSQIVGLSSADFELVTQRAPFQHGRSTIDALLRSRAIKFRLVIRADSIQALEIAKRYAGRIFSPLNFAGQVNLGQLKYVRHDSQEFVIAAVPVGIEMPAGSPSRGIRYQLCNVYLEAEDGFFSDVAASTLSFAVNATEVATNNGDIPVLPFISITGPSNNPMITNLSTGKYFQVTNELTAGYRLDIDFRFGKKTVTRVQISDETVTADWYQYIEAASEWWKLAVGPNSISLTADDNQGSGMITWTQQYQSIA